MVLATSIVVAEDYPLCKDTKGPNAVTGLSASGNVIVSWNAAIDTDSDGHTDPNCNYVDHYLVYRNDLSLGATTLVSYTDSALADGTYTYKIIAVDGASNRGDAATLAYTVGGSPLSGGNGGGGGGGGGSSRNSNKERDTLKETTPSRATRSINGSTNESVNLEASEVSDIQEDKESSPGGITGLFGGEGNTGNLLVTLGLLVLVITGYFGVRNWFNSEPKAAAVSHPGVAPTSSEQTKPLSETPSSALTEDEDDFEIIYPSDTNKKL